MIEGNKFDAMRAAVREATDMLRAADLQATNMASLLRGRLRQVNSAYTLRLLKRELRDFNATTGNWREVEGRK